MKLRVLKFSNFNISIIYQLKLTYLTEAIKTGLGQVGSVMQQVQEVLKNTQPDWLIVDHYSLDKRWELKLKSKVRFIMVIDDLVDRDHYCDLLLDQNFGRKENDYETLLGNECKTLIGPNFAILRPEFEKFRIDSLKNRMANPNCKNLLISLGGVDKDNITTLILNALDKCQGSLDLKITVVIGKNCPWQNEISIMASVIKWPTKVLIDVGNMAELMACVDFSIGAAGSPKRRLRGPNFAR